MTIDRVDYDEIYGDVITPDQLNLLDFIGVEWRGRNVKEIGEDIRVKTIQLANLAYEQAALNKPDQLSQIKALLDYCIEQLSNALEDIEEPDSPNERLRQFDPVSGTYRVLIAAEKKKKKKRKWWVIGALVVVAVTATILTAGTAAAPAGAAVAAAAGAGASGTAAQPSSNRRKNEEDKKTPPPQASSPPPPPKPTPIMTTPSFISSPTSPQPKSLQAEGLAQSVNKPSSSIFENPPIFRPLETSHRNKNSEVNTLPLPVSIPSYSPPKLHPTPQTSFVSPPPSNPPSPNWKPHLPVSTDIQQPVFIPPIKAQTPLIDSNFSQPYMVIDPDSSPRIYNYTNESNQSPNPKVVFEIPGKKLARGAIGGINGIGNTFEDAKANANYLAQLSNNHHIEWVHNRTNSIPIDILETIFVNYPGASVLEKLLMEQWMDFNEKHKNDKGAKYLQTCHSQGATHVRNALMRTPKEIRDRIIVVAIAPASVVSKNLCFASYNYASKKDPVPLAEAAINYDADASYEDRMAEPSRAALKELIFLEPHPDAKGMDHSFDSPTFKDVVERHLREYFSQYGELE